MSSRAARQPPQSFHNALHPYARANSLEHLRPLRFLSLSLFSVNSPNFFSLYCAHRTRVRCRLKVRQSVSQPSTREECHEELERERVSLAVLVLVGGVLAAP